MNDSTRDLLCKSAADSAIILREAFQHDGIERYRSNGELEPLVAIYLRDPRDTVDSCVVVDNDNDNNNSDKLPSEKR